MLLSSLLLSAVVSLAGLAPADPNGELPKQTVRALQKIQSESKETAAIQWNSLTHSPQLVTGKLTEPSAHSPGWIAYGYLERHKGLYGLKRVKEDLQITKVEPIGSSVIVHLQRMLYQKPVCDNQLVVELDQDRVIRRIEGTLHTGLEKQRLGRPMYPAVTQEEARDLAKAHEKTLPPSTPVSIESCYLATRTGVPLVHVATYEKEGRPVSLKIHSLTGRVIP